MKLVLMSDTHGFHDRITVPDGDVVIHAGDATMGGHWEHEVRPFLDWYASLKHKHKILISGNHDWCFEQNPSSMQSECENRGIHLLNDSGITIDCVNFWGSPVQPEFFNWAFNRKRGPEIKKHWDLIPANTDVLITHGPAEGRLDDVVRYYPAGHCTKESVGCADLLQAIDRIQPILHCFGHIHEGYGLVRPSGSKTTFVNASVCTRRYKPINPVIVVDTDELRKNP